MKRKSQELSKFGLPKNFVTSAYNRSVSPEVRRWAEKRNELESMVLDALDAYEAKILTRAEHLAEKKALSFQLRRATQEYEKALKKG